MLKKKKKLASFLIVTVVIFLTSFGGCVAVKSDAGDAQNKEEVLEAVMSRLEKNHYTSIDINDEFSTKVFNAFIKTLDYNKKFFIASDIEKLKKHTTKIDDQILKLNFKFFDDAIALADIRIDKAQSYYQDILSSPFDFTVDEDIEIDIDKISFAKDEAELKEAWRKALKYQVLIRIVEVQEIQEAPDRDSSIVVKPFETIETEAREKVLKNNNEWFKRLKRLDDNDRLSSYINTITSVYDPHSGYYPPKDKENFDINISGQLEGIGATLQEKDGHIKIVHIVPGSASWKQGELKEGDVILKVAQGSDEAVDIVDMPLDDAVKLIRGPKGSEVRLTVKKVDGTTTIIPIIRDVVILSETFAKSAIIEDDDTKIGFIKLPKFYVDFNNPNGRRCATDVQKEIEKIKEEEGVDGIVIDLRHNSGGSLRDVVEMTGLFIESGPIVQVQGRDAKPAYYQDYNKSILYDGPLVILVDESSASASEIMAAAVQDYNRGIIIGSTSTFGKGTVQQFYPLYPLDGTVKDLGAIKLTTQKFYRVNGGATQLKGVIPDIVLPDAYTYIEYGEKEIDYALEWDEIASAPVKPWEKLNKTQVEAIKGNSIKRVENDSTFGKIIENALRLKNNKDFTIYSLNLKKYRATLDKMEEESKKFENIFKEIDGIDVSILQQDLPEIESDTVKSSSFNNWSKSIKKDVYIKEALEVIEDLD